MSGMCTRGHLMAETRKFHPNGDSYCSACKFLRHDVWRKTDEGKLKEKQYRRKSNLKRFYGLSTEDYSLLEERSGGRCMICNGLPGRRKLHIDHEHSAGKVRGLLCHNCNTALGLLKENPETIKAMLAYLKQ